MDGCEILHQLIGGKHPTIHRVSTCFNHPRWCRISSIHSISVHITFHCCGDVPLTSWWCSHGAMAPWATNGLPRLVKSLVVWRIETMAPCSTNNLQNGSSQKIYLQIWSYKSWPIRISPSSPQNHRKLHTPPRWPVVSNHIERKALESAHTSCHDSPQKVDLKPSGSGTTIETQGLNGTSDEGFHVNVQDGAPVR